MDKSQFYPRHGEGFMCTHEECRNRKVEANWIPIPADLTVDKYGAEFVFNILNSYSGIAYCDEHYAALPDIPFWMEA